MTAQASPQVPQWVLDSSEHALLTLDLPLPIRSPDSTIICTSTMHITLGYNKPSGTSKIEEFGGGNLTNDCTAQQVPTLRFSGTITHQCVPGSYANNDTNQGSAPGPVVINPYQQVRALHVGLFSVQWCYYGSSISWHYIATAVSNIGDIEQFCWTPRRHTASGNLPPHHTFHAEARTTVGRRRYDFRDHIFRRFGSVHCRRCIRRSLLRTGKKATTVGSRLMGKVSRPVPQ